MVLEAFNNPLVKREFDIPRLESGQVLVRLRASGVCGSDVHMWKGEDPRTPLPLIPGHEGVGDVADIGGGKTDVDGRPLAVGDTIVWNRGVTCGGCRYCAVLKEPSLCTNRLVYGITESSADPPHLNGCYAEYIVLRKGTDIFTVSPDVDPAVLVPASCSGATAAHAFDAVEGGLVGRTVVVQGPGPVGMFAVAFAKSLGASDIAVIGGTQSRLDLTKDFGASLLLNRRETSAEDRLEAVLSRTNRRGADVVIEAAGTKGAVEEGIRLLRKGGLYLSTGFSQPAGTEAIDFYRDIVSRNIRIQGVWVSDSGHVKRAVDLLLAEPQTFAKLVTHRFGLDRANDALAAVDSREAAKAVLTFET